MQTIYTLSSFTLATSTLVATLLWLKHWLLSSGMVHEYSIHRTHRSM